MDHYHTWKNFNIGRHVSIIPLFLLVSQNFFPDQMVNWCQQSNGGQAQLLQVLSKHCILAETNLLES
jgi:hypothetical protein